MSQPIFALSLLALVLVSGWASTSANASCIGSGCVLVWADEFDGNAVDTGKWEFMIGNGSAYGIPGWGNNELQYYRSQNATVANGVLTITARQNDSGFNYTSARLRTRNLGDWQYGRFEMRAKLPTGQGLWPAFWMLPTDNVYGNWAASGEIDIMEQIGSEPDRILGSLHYGGTSPENVYTTSVYNLASGQGANFHVYAVEWEDGEFRWYVDDVLYGTRTQWYSAGGPFPAPFDQQFHLLLNLAVGGNLPGNPNGSTPFPSEYVIDYVRVYQLPANLVPPKRVFDDMEHGNPFANDWFIFESGIAGGGLDGNFSDLPPANSGNASLQTGWGSGGMPGYFGGFGRTRPTSLADMTEFRFWINPDPGQSYTLEINLQDDDDGNGLITNSDDEFQFNCVISATGPCAVAGGGWQLVSIPLDDFFDDNSVFVGGNGVLDAIPVAAGGNGELVNVVAVVVSNSGADVSFRTDYWTFYGELADTDGDGLPDVADNCLAYANPGQADTDGDAIGNACDPDIAPDPNDCAINFADLSALRSAFFSTPGSPTWNPDADFTGDDVVNFADTLRMKDLYFGAPGPSGLPNGCL